MESTREREKFLTIPESLHTRLKAYAATRGTNMKAIASVVLEDYLKVQEKVAG